VKQICLIHLNFQILQSKIARILEAARYFVVEDIAPEEWRHFALSFDVYTHFTSPIRRYPDVLVHRLAEKCLSYKNEVNKHVNKVETL
jgi:DIS3-like exonuclease 2